jgi:diguanylate cyclase (GGDEF)-like protein/PAS domain S-box-containing protein
LLSPFLGGYYFSDITSSIQNTVQSYGARLIAIRSAGKNFDSPIALDHVDGWIVLLDAVTDNYLQFLHDEVKKPIVTIAKDITSLHLNGQMVFCDNEGGIKQAVHHLVEHGHRSIGFIGYLELDDMRLRLKGYREELSHHQIAFNPDYVIDPKDYGVMGGRRAADLIVRDGFPFRAAVVGTDLNAVGIIERLTELGYRVPEDFAMIGFDNANAGKTSLPRLSSVDQNIYRLGESAVKLLFDQFNHTPCLTNPYLVGCDLVVRASCGCVESEEIRERTIPLSDPLITKAELEKKFEVNHEFNKFITNYKFEVIRDLSWILAPFFQWGCLGRWNRENDGPPMLNISQFYHFRKNYELSNLMNVEMEAFPPYELQKHDSQQETSEIIYMLPFRTEGNHGCVLAMGASFMNFSNQIDAQDNMIHYLDMMANALERQSLLEEVRQQGLQFKSIAEQLEVVSRTSNDGIWDWDLTTGAVNWNQRFFNLLELSTPSLFEGIVHTDDYAIYSKALLAHLQQKALFEIELRLRKQDGAYVWVIASGEALYDAAGNPVRMIGSVRDISDRKHAEMLMYNLAYHDSLTGLTNRLSFYEVIKGAVRQRPDEPFAIMVLDLDHFKKINDTYGHQMGDRLLEHVATHLKNLVNKSEHIARFGGDEFVLIYPYEHPGEVNDFAQSIALELSTPMICEAVHIGITTSVGISLYPLDGQDTDTLIKKADIAMFRAKQGGKNRFEIFSPHMIEQTMWRINMENQLQAALANHEFLLYYQPQIDLQTGRVYGVEALLRWDSPSRGIVSPLEFISLAEETGLIIPIGEWALLEACRQNKRWAAKGYKPIKISVNISGQQLKQIGFVAHVKAIIEKTEMDPRYLCFEITESTIIDNLEGTIEMLKELTAMGIRISLDDFGTGYSSLSILKKLPISMVKIDKSFISEMTLEHRDLDMVKAIIFISNSLQLEVVAEGIEQRVQFELLKELGCHYMQGYYTSPPLPSEQFEIFLDLT